MRSSGVALSLVRNHKLQVEISTIHTTNSAHVDILFIHIQRLA